MKYLKSILIFGLLLVLYFVPAFLYQANPNVYEALNKPSYAPNSLIFGIAWPILFSLLSLYLTLQIHKKTLSKEMLLYFLINYGISFFFNKEFFIERNLFLSFSITFCSFISGVFIFMTSFKKSKKLVLLLIPYLLWTLYASILMTHIYLINS